MSENKAEKYSNQCFVAQTGKKTMSVDSYLTEPADNGLTPPLTMLSDFSRFRVTIINFSTESKKYVFANILAKALVTVTVGIPISLLVCLTIRWCRKILGR